MATGRSNWGGKREGAGRPRTRAIASEPHKVRPVLAARHPVHVVTRVVQGAKPLTRRETYRAIRRAVMTSLARCDFRIVRIAVRKARLELLVEAENKTALARGMQGFQVAAARRLNGALGRKGNVFPDRYRSRVLPTKGAVRDAVRTTRPPATGLAAAVAELFEGGAHPARAATATGAWFAAAYPVTWLLRTALSGRIRPRPRRATP